MRAITVLPGVAHSARLDDIDEPATDAGRVLVRTLALGVCGTDREIVAGQYGEAPPSRERLVLGHESYGEVIEAPAGSGLAPGDRVAGIVRRPDPVPCPACAAGEWDMCANGHYTEHGIRGLDGFAAERFRTEPAFAVKLDPALGDLGVLIEPASIVAKAWDHIGRIGQRFRSWRPKRLLVTGSGPIGLLGALIGAQRGYEVHVLDRSRPGSPKPAIVNGIGGHHHAGTLAAVATLEPDVILECTGAPQVIADTMAASAPNGIVSLLGLCGHRELTFDIGGFNDRAVLGNRVVFGAVNANRMHYEMAAEALARADRNWLGRLISRRVPLARFAEALEHRPDDIKVVVDFAA